MKKHNRLCLSGSNIRLDKFKLSEPAKRQYWKTFSNIRINLCCFRCPQLLWREPPCPLRSSRLYLQLLTNYIQSYAAISASISNLASAFFITSASLSQHSSAYPIVLRTINTLSNSSWFLLKPTAVFDASERALRLNSFKTEVKTRTALAGKANVILIIRIH